MVDSRELGFVKGVSVRGESEGLVLFRGLLGRVIGG